MHPAQNFPGSNNVPLLQPIGQFGTRATGGDDAAAGRYLFTKLSPVTPMLFPRADEPVLERLSEDGELVEPKFYVPILPVLLLNGSKGIGTGWSTQVQCYHPLEVLDNVRANLLGQSMQPMRPWFNGFTGTITEKTTGIPGWISTGCAEWRNKQLLVTELPVRVWTSDYKAWLLAQTGGAEAQFASLTEAHTERTVSFCLQPNADLDTEESVRNLRDDQLIAQMKLRSSLLENNMHAFGVSGELLKFDSPLDIIEYHAPLRLSTYQARKDHLLTQLQHQLQLLESRRRFIDLVLRGEITLSRVSRASLLEELQRKNFIPSSGAADEELRNVSSGYAHLLDMPLSSLTEESVLQLNKQVDEKRKDHDEVRATDETTMWLRELEELRTELERIITSAPDRTDGTTPKPSRTTKRNK